MLHLSRCLGCLALLLPSLALAAPRVLDLAGPDKAALLAEDRARDDGGPERFAWPRDLSLTPDDGAGWDRLADGSHRWRLEIRAPGALSLNLGFARFRLPWGGELRLSGERGPDRVFTAADNRPHGRLWTPVVLGDAALLTLTVPAGDRDLVELELARVSRGYRFFGEPRAAKQGDCNIDVVCPEGEPWRAEIRSVGVYTLNGSWKCTGAMINNTAEDETPYFLTALHCGVDPADDETLVVYWNFESPECGLLSGGSLDDTQTGAIWRASHTSTDMTLLELAAPPDTSWHVTFAGWDRSGVVPSGAVAIHHPSTDEKAISFEDDPLQITSYIGYDTPGDGTHWRVVDWDLGTTETGSSGSPLFDPSQRVIGQLHGGYAACGNDLSDWYGRFDLSWEGDGTAAGQLAHWLDPLGEEPLALSTLDPYSESDPDPPLPPELVTLQGPPSNPFVAGGAVPIRFELPRPGHVRLTIHDLRGRRVAAIVDRELPAGVHAAPWSSAGLAAGVYIVRLEALGEEHGVTFTLLR